MKKHFLLALCAITYCCLQLSAQDNANIKSLSIFKNGQSFVIKEASVNTENGIYKISKLPNALFGTYWFNGISSPISSVTSKIEDFIDKRERKANSFLELLHANKGMEITVNTTDNQIYKGIVEDFDLPEEINSKVKLQQLQLSNDYAGLYEFDRIFTTVAPVLLLKVSGKWVSIEPSTIKSLEFAQKPSRTTIANIAVQKPIVTIHFEKTGKQDFRYMYLQTGISWTPVYKMSLLSETEAEVNLQAEVINTVENIKNTNVDFVVGVPNFSQATNLATLLNYTNIPVSYKNTENYRQYSNALAEKTVDVGYFSPTNTVGSIASSENEDLYFYTVKDMNLEKGEHAQFSLFKQKVKIAHVYKCNLPASPFSNYALNAEDQSDTEDPQDESSINPDDCQTVGHYIEVSNNGNMPFTSGPILLLQGDDENVISQDVLPFIAKGSHAPLYVTSSPDIIVRENEKIVSVKRASKKIDNSSYHFACQRF